MTPEPLHRFDAALPRHAFSVRNAARAGDVWRMLQEVAVEASTRVGWPPMRYRAEGAAFVMRTMDVVHVREALYGERLVARTWVEPFKRGVFSTRQIRIDSAEDGSLIARATQQWVHVDRSMKPARASAALQESFVPLEAPDDPGAALPPPAHEALEGAPVHRFAFEPWFTWMDPLDHVNHPAYVDFCDEGIARVAHHASLRPVTIRPVAERMTYSRGVEALERTVVETQLAGRTAEGACVCAHRILLEDGTLCARGTTVRESVDEGGTDALAAALGGSSGPGERRPSR